MTLSDDELTRHIAGLRAGDADALAAFFTRFAPILERLADRNLSPAVKRRLGPEDVALSACRTFFRRTKEGEFTLDDGDAIWRLICAITLTKAREKSRFHHRAKRGIHREVALADGTDSRPGPTPAAAGPDPADLAEFHDLLEFVLAELDDEERAMLELKLRGHTHDEIAERLGCSERTVRRLLKKIRANLAAKADA